MKLNKLVKDSSLLAHAAEMALELSRDEEITSKEIRNKPGTSGEGVGILVKVLE